MASQPGFQHDDEDREDDGSNNAHLSWLSAVICPCDEDEDDKNAATAVDNDAVDEGNDKDENIHLSVLIMGCYLATVSPVLCSSGYSR